MTGRPIFFTGFLPVFIRLGLIDLGVMSFGFVVFALGSGFSDFVIDVCTTDDALVVESDSALLSATSFIQVSLITFSGAGWGVGCAYSIICISFDYFF